MHFTHQKLREHLKTLSPPFIGVDEVGRGCLAGPVFAAAVAFKSSTDITKYRDSKAIDQGRREHLAFSIRTHHYVAIASASVAEIDKHNILQATFLAMRRAVEALAQQMDVTSATLLVDGRDQIPNFDSFQQQAVIQGDAKVRLISAASIAAKVARDHFMTQLAAQFKNYGFEKHKGYGTKFHRERIQKFGPTEWHRQTFSGVREYL